MKFNNGYGRKACAAGLALATALAMVPSVAFGASLDSNTGDITISDLGAGDTVTAYEILDRDYNKASNTVTDKFIQNAGVSQTTFQGLTSDGSVYSKGSAMQLAADTIANAIKTGKATALATMQVSANDKGVATFENAPAGEWLILVTSADGTVTKVYQNTIVSNAPEAKDGQYVAKDATATIKYTDEKVQKGIGTTAEDVTKKTADGTYGIGDLVPFVISTTIPNYPANSTAAKFVIGDTPSAGLAIQNDATNQITVSVNGTAVDAIDKDTGAKNYSLSLEKGILTITFDKAYILKHTGESVLVNYKAKVTSDAKVTAADTTHNSATITFNTNPYEESESKPGDENKVKTYGVFFVKKTPNDAALQGAQFKIKYAQDINGHKKGDYVKDENGTDLTSTSDGNGYVYFEDLAKGKYTLEEVQAPTGYQKVNIDVDLTNGASADNPVTGVKEANYLDKGDVTDPNVGMLPTTGDAGTIGLTAAGILLVAGSAFVVIGHNKRAKDEEK
jgi:fimbrial isopeptide formation D2 family protein/LPXTG-motif cell wall-anchored protein